MVTISSLSEIRHLDIEQDLVSFDVFDTLVYRRYLEVNEVHDLVSAFALSVLGKFGSELPGDLTLTRYATTNTLKASAQKRVEEPSLEDVWTRLFVARLGLNEQAIEGARKVAAFEFEIDRQNLYAVDGAADMLSSLRAKGKRLVAVSDMYFSQSQVEKILESAGLLQFFERVFVSADENLTKHSGNLFGHVWKSFGVTAARALHVGDNTHSDVAMPRSLGAAAVHVAHAPLLKIDRPDYGRRPDIHMEVGDLCKLFLAQLMFCAQSDGTDKVFFLSRDGCLLNKVLQRWNSPLLQAFFTPVESEDLFLSRATTCWLNVNFQERWLLQSLGHAFWLHHGKATPRQLSAMFGIAQIPSGLDADRIYFSATETFVVLDAYVAAGLEDDIRKAILEKRASARAYLRDSGFFDHRSVHVCDVGYSGTVVRDLNTFFLQEGSDDLQQSIPQVHFHCIATNSNYTGNARAALPHVLFQDDVILADAAIPTPLKESFAWLEMFFKHPLYGPLLGFRQEGGKTVPSYEVATQEDPHHPSHQILATIASDPSDIVFLWMAAIRFWSQFTDPLLNRFMHPDKATIEQMLSDVYEVDAVSGKTRSVVLLAPELTDEEIHRRAREEDYWIPGSITASRLARDAMRPDHNRTTHPRLDALITGHLDAIRSTEAQGFDPVFYRRFYRDLNALPNDRALEDHYLTHGKLVGRFGSEPEMLTQLHALMRDMPAGFDAGAYFLANSDLPVLEPCTWQAVQHYARVGGAERRPFHHDFGEIDEAFESLVTRGSVTLTEVERAEHEKGAPARVLLLRRYGAVSSPWLAMIDLQEFNALNFAWSAPTRNVAEAALALLEDGIARLAPLSLSAAFDPQFYRRQYPDVADLDDAEAYRHWLSAGSLLKRAPSEEAALDRMIGQRTYPPAFRWDMLQKRDPARLGRATRLELLDEFLNTAYPDQTDLVEGTGSGDLWVARSARAAASGDHETARAALVEATRAEPERGVFWHTLGDYYNARGDLHAALQAFSRSLETDTPNRWSFINCIRISAELGAYENGLRYLKAAQPVWKDTQPWREARQILFQRWFDDRALHCYDPLLKTDVRANSHADTRFRRFMKTFVPAVASTGIPEQLELARDNGPILILSGSVISERTRWEAALRAPNGESRRVMLFSREQLDLFSESLPGASVALFHEVEIDSLVLDVLLTAKAVGVRRLFWAGPLGRTDEPTSPDLSDLAWSDFLLARDSREVGTTLRSIYAATLCDDVVLTTPSLVSSLNELGIRPHMGSSALLEALRETHDLFPRAPGATRLFCALTGRPARATPDDRQAQAPQIGQIDLMSCLGNLLRNNPGLSILVEGMDASLEIPKGLGSRIERLSQSLTFDQRLAALSQCAGVLDLRHSRRDRRALEDEASWSGLPTVLLADCPSLPGSKANRVATVAELAARVTAWLAGPTTLVDSGAAARSTFDTLLAKAPASLAPLRAIPEAKAKPRILLANLFAPPQTIGGATRVVADNLDYMITNAADDYDFAVLTSDDDNRHRGVTRIDSWRGVPVFRIATPQEIDMDWRTYNAEVDLHARHVIDLVKPDLVHIHCLPRLSVAVAEACRSMGVPYVITLHDAWWLSDFPFLVQENGTAAGIDPNPSTQPYSHRIGLPRSLERAVRMRAALKGAMRLLSVSEEFAQVYRQAGFTVSTIANGVSPLEPAARTSSSGRVRLGHVGGLQHHKGAYLIEAALRARNYSNLSLTILELARDPGSPLYTTWGNTPVVIRGKVPAEKISTLYAEMDVLLAPSTWPESFGLVSREAAQCGLWVVASNQGAMGSDIVEGENGFVIDTTSPADLVRVLEVIDADPKRFTASPHGPLAPQRQSDDQARDVLALYKTLIAH
jgi:HAD superfamily hydrolase (TIGR01549 family)